MTEFIIQFVGIVLFVAGSGTGSSDPRMAMLPQHLTDGMHQGKTVHAHVPYLAFPGGAKLNWDGKDLKQYPSSPGMVYMALRDGYEISVNASDTSLKVNESHYGSSGQAVIPRVRSYCPDFAFDAAKPRAATVAVNVGELSGFIDTNHMAYSEWKVKVVDTLTITAKRGSDQRTITLPKGARVIIGNSPRSSVEKRSEVASGDKHHHYYIYYKMDKDANNACTARPSDAFKPLDLHAHGLAPQHASVKRDAKTKQQKDSPVAAAYGDRDTDADCSNSNYP